MAVYVIYVDIKDGAEQVTFQKQDSRTGRRIGDGRLYMTGSRRDALVAALAAGAAFAHSGDHHVHYCIGCVDCGATKVRQYIEKMDAEKGEV